MFHAACMCNLWREVNFMNALLYTSPLSSLLFVCGINCLLTCVCVCVQLHTYAAVDCNISFPLSLLGPCWDIVSCCLCVCVFMQTFRLVLGRIAGMCSLHVWGIRLCVCVLSFVVKGCHPPTPSPPFGDSLSQTPSISIPTGGLSHHKKRAKNKSKKRHPATLEESVRLLIANMSPFLWTAILLWHVCPNQHTWHLLQD